MCHFIQFYNVLKISVEIFTPFVYNVRIAVHCTQTVRVKGISLSERSF